MSIIEYIRSKGLEKEMRWKGFSVAQLKGIISNYESKLDQLDKAMFGVLAKVKTLGSYNLIKSTKYRVKSPERVIEKVIKNKLSLKNYFHSIKDLIGIRLLYLVDEDRSYIVQDILKVFENSSIEKKVFLASPITKQQRAKRESIGYKVEKTTSGYSWALHFTVQYDEYKCEIQLRSIFMESRCELEHYLSYSQVEISPIVKEALLSFKYLTDASQSIANQIIKFQNYITVKDREQEDSNKELKKLRKKWNSKVDPKNIYMPNTSDFNYNINNTTVRNAIAHWVVATTTTLWWIPINSNTSTLYAGETNGMTISGSPTFPSPITWAGLTPDDLLIAGYHLLK